MRSDLGRIVGAEHVFEPPPGSPYNRDATLRRGLQGRADAVVLPGDAQEVAAVLAWCYERGVPLVTRGGGTGLAGGAVPSEGGVVCSLERLTAVLDVEPALWRLRVQAGVTTAHVHRLARENGLVFPPDPGAGEQSTIGGNVATNAGGPHALKYGVTGRYVAGLQAVVAPGEIVRVGGWAQKDVSTYDLRSLLVGSEGTLAVITEVSLRLLPAPAAADSVVLFASDAASGCDAILESIAAGIRPAALDFLDRAALAYAAAGYPGEIPAEAGFALLFDIDGTEDEVAEQRGELLELLAGELAGVDTPDRRDLWRWRDSVNGRVAAARGAKVAEDVVLPVERLREALEQFGAIAERHGLPSCSWGHGGDGNMHANLLTDPESVRDAELAQRICDEFLASVAAMGGSIAGEHGIGRVKTAAAAEHLPAATLELQARVKREFDPRNLLNPAAKVPAAATGEGAAVKRTRERKVLQ
ncbi:MAG TPA: FAD-linked oxidase C-terminal domain-containing protein [Solirubrobacteraceae bacterium]|nr:FAD-linked oxidase C-terminal domain-containing protein [Solirubrobacteraceae bacterium]